MAKTITYRAGTALDVSNIVRLFKEEYARIKVPYPAISDIRAVAYVANMLGDGVVKVADLSGRVIGAALGIPVRPAWTDLWVVSVPHLLVEPNFRKHGVAQNLIRVLVAWAHEKKLPVRFDIDTGGDDVVMKDRFLAMQGLTYTGGSFLSWPKDLPAKG